MRIGPSKFSSNKTIADQRGADHLNLINIVAFNANGESHASRLITTGESAIVVIKLSNSGFGA